MKNLKIFGIIVLMFIAGSCGNDFVDTEPFTQISDANYYETPQDAWETLVGCYSQLGNGSWAEFFMAINISSDEVFGGGGYTDDLGKMQWDQFQVFASQEDLNNSTWGSYFRKIRRTTVLTEFLEKMKDFDEKTTYMAEARFLRAYFVFEMQRNYGHIPLNKTSLSENIEQTDPHEVYRYIVEDLKFAINNLPSVKWGNIADENVGRATKWAAIGFMARVYMFYTGYYSDAGVGGAQDIGVTKDEVLTWLENCIANSGHELVPRYGSLWPWSKRQDYHNDPTLDYAGENNPEIVFAIKHSINNINGFPRFFGMRGEPERGAYNPFFAYWGMITINPKAYNQYEDCDERRFASIIAVEEEGIPNDGTDQRDFTGYYQKKYQILSSEGDPTISDPQANGASSSSRSYQDRIVLRFSEILLDAAELGSPNAQAYLDMIRDRAFNDTDHRISANFENIFQERSKEFVCEQIRYYDLLRRGLQYAKSQIDEDCEVLNGKVPGRKIINFPLDKQGLLRIPESEITISGGTVIQNPGWNK